MSVAMPDLNSLLPVIPREPGLRAHVYRVAVLVSRAANAIGYSAGQIGIIETAALLHHLPVDAPPDAEVQRLLSDLGFGPTWDLSSLPPDARDVLLAFRGFGSGSGFSHDAAALVESANFFDEQMESLPYEDVSVAEAIANLLEAGVICPAFATAVASFRRLQPESLRQVVQELPVFPAAATEAMRLARDPQADLRSLENAIARDAVLAGAIVELANSARFDFIHPVNSLQGALSRIGLDAASKSIATAAFRPYFLSGEVHRLWLHAAETGENAARIANEAATHSGEAYLAGLVHDIGRLALERSPAISEIRRWTEAGFPAVYAEFLVAGTDHAAVGADILQSWLFPDTIVDAVRYHHRPELSTSRLSAVLYIAEEDEESLPSIARDHLVAKRLERSNPQPLRRAAG